jgi:hypothetical protein
VPQVVCRDPDVGPDRMPHERIRIVSELCRQQNFHGGPDAVDDRTQIARLVLPRPHQLFQRGRHRPAPGVAQHHDERRPEALGGKLHAANLRGRDDIAGDADDKQVAEALVEDDLRRYPRVGTPEDDGERFLVDRQLMASRLAREPVAVLNARHEATVPLLQAFECVLR